MQILQFNITTANEGAIFALTNRVITLVDAVSALDPSTFRGITTALGVLLGTLAAFAGVAVSVRAVRALQTAFEGVSTAVRAVSAASPVLRAASESTRVYAAALDGARLGNSRFAASQHASRTASRSLLMSLRATSAFAAGPYVLAFAAAAGGALLLLHATRGVRREAEFLTKVLADGIEPAEGVDALREQLEQLQEVYRRVQQDAEKFRPGSRGAELAERAMVRLRVEITEVGVALQEVTGVSIVSLPQLAGTIDMVTEQMRTLNEEIEQLQADDGDTRQIAALVEEYNRVGAELGSLLAIQREIQDIEFLDDADPIRFASAATEATEAWRIFRDELEAGTGTSLEDLQRGLEAGLVSPLKAAQDEVKILEQDLEDLLEARGQGGELLFNVDDKSVQARTAALNESRVALASLEAATKNTSEATNSLAVAYQNAVKSGDQFVRVSQGNSTLLLSLSEAAIMLNSSLGELDEGRERAVGTLHAELQAQETVAEAAYREVQAKRESLAVIDDLVAGREKSLGTLHAELQAQETVAEAAYREVQAKRESLAVIDDLVAGREKSLGTLHAELQAQETVAEAAYREVQAKRESLAVIDDLVAGREKSLGTLHAELQAQETVAEAAYREVQAKRESLAVIDDLVAGREKSLGTLHAELQTQETVAEAAYREVQAKRESLAVIDDLVAGREKSLGTLHAELQTQETVAEAAYREVQAKRESLAVIDDLVAGREKSLGTLHAELQTQETVAEAAYREVQAKRESLAVIDDLVAGREKSLGTLHAELQTQEHGGGGRVPRGTGKA